METLDLTEFVEPNPIKKLKFPYNFNEYLRFFLLKKLPPRSKTIKINS